MKKKLLVLMSMLLAVSAIHAVPAKRGIWKTFTLKNGQAVQVQLCGDEFLHFWEDKAGNRYSYDTSDGLKPGDLIVSAGIHYIENGEIVKPLPVASETNIGGLL